MKLPWNRKQSKEEDDENAPLIGRNLNSYGGKDADSDTSSEKKQKPEKTKRVSLSQLYRYADRCDMLILLIGGCLAAITGMGLPMLSIVMGQVSQDFITAAAALMFAPTDEARTAALDEFSSAVISGCIQYLVVGVVMFVSASIQVSCFLTACERMTDRLRRAFVKAVLRQDIAWFDQSHSGTLASKLFDNMERVREGTGDKVALLIQYTTQFLGGFIVAFGYDWRLTLIMMSLAPFMILCGAFMAKLMATATADESRNYAVAGGIAEEVLSSIRTVHAFNAQPHEVSRYESALAAGKATGIKKAVYVGLGLGCTFLIIFSSYCLAFWVGTDYVAWGWLQPGTVMTVFFAVMMGSMALGLAGPQFAVIGIAQGAACTLYEVIDRVPEIDAYSPEGIIPKETLGHVEFKGVRFSYPNRAEVEILKGIDVECHPGQTVAFVGASGCGKSTSISLLLRYYDPTAGRILIDGVDLRNLNIEYLRKTIGVVSQEPVLFDTTIEENIMFGREDVTKEEMYAALKKANAYEFVSTLPEGVHTLVGTRGTQLSGGQKQRIAIARALVRNPKILLLDEATSALDAQSEGVVQRALENASRGRTTFIVAHRLSTIQNADCIVVFKEGQIVERGKHEELLNLRGHYYALVHSQVFADLDQEEEEDGPRKISSSRLSRGLSRGISQTESALTKEGEDDMGDSKKANELARLKKELAEEGVERVGLLGILTFARPEWIFIAIALISSSIQGCIFPVFSLFFTDMMNVFTNPDIDAMRSEGHFYSLLFLALGLANGLTSLTSAFLFGYISERLSMRLRLSVFRRLLSMNIAFMDDPKHAPGKLCTRLATDAPMVKTALDYRLGAVVSCIVSISFGIAIAFYYGWQMAILMLLLFPLAVVGHSIQWKYSKNNAESDDANLESAGKVASEAMENVRTVQALTLEKTIMERFCSHLDGPLRTSRRRALMQGVSYGFSSSIYYFMYAAAFRFGLWLIVAGYSDPMSVLRVLFAISFSAGRTGMASAFFPEYVKATLAAGLIFSMMRLRTAIEASSDSVGAKSSLQGEIQLRKVKFAYAQRPEVTVLRGVDLSIHPGQTVAIVGPSGCGKSTVVSLVERFYDPAEGAIIVDGVELTARNLRDVRRQMAIVSQEPTLFDMTIRDNIAYGVDNVSEEMIVNAAKMANAHDFIRTMPAGYDTRVGEKGTQLSGGQKQRVAIARALVRNPKILLLDEATSALDMESEQIVQAALDSASQGRTCIMIAHRLATVVNADRIVVVNEGRIVEQGSHDELMSARGAYHRLYAQQSKKTE